MIKIEYTNEAAAQGRNGFFKNLKGIQINMNGEEVWFNPIGKSGVMLNAGFSIPTENVQAFIIALEKETGLEEN